MFLKSIFLLCITTVLSYYHLRITPDELQTTWETIEAEVKAQQHEAQITIRAAQVPIAFYCDESETYYVGNLSVATQPYWKQIEDFEANAGGVVISDCIELGNIQLNSLNNSLVSSAFGQIESLRALGLEVVYNSSIPGYVTDDLVIYSQKVEACSDDTCASKLQVEIILFYNNATTTITNSLHEVQNFVNQYLPENLANIALDSDTYVKNYTVFLNDVDNCINSKL